MSDEDRKKGMTEERKEVEQNERGRRTETEKDRMKIKERWTGKKKGREHKEEK